MIILLTFILSIFLFCFYLSYFLLVYFNSRKTHSYYIDKTSSYLPLVSVIIPTYNEETTIQKKLQNILEQKYSNYDINIIDSASKDNTVDLINEFIKENNVDLNFIIEEKRNGKAFALNKMFKKAKGEIIVITDADVLFENTVIGNMVKNFTNKKVGAVTGRQIIFDKNLSNISENEKAYKNIFDVLRKGESNLDSTMIFNGPAMAFRSSLLESLPEDTIADDSSLAMMIRKKGYKAIFDENVIFYESVFSGTYFLNQKIRRGQGVVQAFLRNLDFLFNPKYGKYGMLLFPAEFFMHIISPIMCLILTFLGFNLMINEILFFYVFLGLTLSFLLLSKLKFINIDKIIFAFLEYQCILLLSLLSHVIGIKQHKWTVLDRNVLAINEGN